MTLFLLVLIVFNLLNLSLEFCISVFIALSSSPYFIFDFTTKAMGAGISRKYCSLKDVMFFMPLCPYFGAFNG